LILYQFAESASPKENISSIGCPVSKTVHNFENKLASEIRLSLLHKDGVITESGTRLAGSMQVKSMIFSPARVGSSTWISLETAEKIDSINL
jgi:hypothetical protein